MGEEEEEGGAGAAAGGGVEHLQAWNSSSQLIALHIPIKNHEETESQREANVFFKHPIVPQTENI